MPYEFHHGCGNDRSVFASGTKHRQQRFCLCNMIVLASETDDVWVRSNGHRLLPSHKSPQLYNFRKPNGLTSNGHFDDMD
ncbi:hypothetical protein ACFX13_020510 [Malus domestica]